MDKTEKFIGIPLSKAAEMKISSVRSYYRGFIFCLFLAASSFIVSVVGAVTKYASSKALAIVFGFMCLESVIFCLVLWFWNIKGEKEVILAHNEKDYYTSLRLKELLDNFKSKSTAHGINEKQIEGQWRPFRIEHYLSASLCAEIWGFVSAGFLTGGMANLHLAGISIPNLLDSCSVLFLKSGDKTLRALIPSSSAAKELFVQAFERFQWPHTSYWDESHTGNVVRGFSLSDEDLVSPLLHPELIDTLDASCQSPFEERPIVKVWGEKVQEGIVVAAALQINGAQKIFWPSGFFSKFISGVSSILEIEKKEIKTAEAICRE